MVILFFIFIWAVVGVLFQALFFYVINNFFNEFYMKYYFDAEGWVFNFTVTAIMVFAAYVIHYVYAEIWARNVAKDIVKDIRNRRDK